MKLSDVIAALALVISLGGIFFGVYQEDRKRADERTRVYRGSFAIGVMWADVHRYVTWQLGEDDPKRDDRTTERLRRLLPLVKAMGLDIDPSVYRYADAKPDKPGEVNVGTLLYNALQLRHNDRLAVTAFVLGDDLTEMCDFGSLDDMFKSSAYVDHTRTINPRLKEIDSLCPRLRPLDTDPEHRQKAVSTLHDCLESKWTIVAQQPSWYDRAKAVAAFSLMPTVSHPEPAGPPSVPDYDWCKYHHDAFQAGFSGG